MSDAEDRLEAAVHDVAVESESIRDGEIITSWVLVGCAVGPAVDETSYFRIFQGGSLPEHIVLGLLDYAHTMERAEIVTAPDARGDE